MPVTSIQFGQSPWHYANGLGLSNDATTPHSIIDVAAGSIMDSTGVYQITTTTALKSSLLVSGFAGLDTGAVAANKVYAVYLVADPVDYNATGVMFSLSLTGPLMPFGYSIWALVGYVATDGSKYILPGYWTAGNSTQRTFTFDAFAATAVTAGASTSYANVDLTKWVPLVNNLPVQVYTSYVPETAGNILSLQAGNATGAQAVITGQVTTIAVTTISTILAQTVAISTVPSPTINYKVGNGSDAVAIDVAGYTFFI